LTAFRLVAASQASSLPVAVRLALISLRSMRVRDPSSKLSVCRSVRVRRQASTATEVTLDHASRQACGWLRTRMRQRSHTQAVTACLQSSDAGRLSLRRCATLLIELSSVEMWECNSRRALTRSCCDSQPLNATTSGAPHPAEAGIGLDTLVRWLRGLWTVPHWARPLCCQLLSQ